MGQLSLSPIEQLMAFSHVRFCTSQNIRWDFSSTSIYSIEVLRGWGDQRFQTSQLLFRHFAGFAADAADAADAVAYRREDLGSYFLSRVKLAPNAPLWIVGLVSLDLRVSWFTCQLRRNCISLSLSSCDWVNVWRYKTSDNWDTQQELDKAWATPTPHLKCRFAFSVACLPCWYWEGWKNGDGPGIYYENNWCNFASISNSNYFLGRVQSTLNASYALYTSYASYASYESWRFVYVFVKSRIFHGHPMLRCRGLLVVRLMVLMNSDIISGAGTSVGCFGHDGHDGYGGGGGCGQWAKLRHQTYLISMYDMCKRSDACGGRSFRRAILLSLSCVLGPSHHVNDVTEFWPRRIADPRSR